MDIDQSEQTDPRPKRPPVQFGLRTMFLVMIAFAVLCSMLAWLGLALVVLVALVLAGAAGTFVGLLACPLFGLGYTFEDLRWDIAKCFLVSLSIVLPVWVLMHLATFPTGLTSLGILAWLVIHSFPTGLIPVGILAWFVINLLWCDFSMGQILMVECFMLSIISVVAVIIL